MEEQTASPVQELSPEQQSLKQQFEFHSAMAFGEKPPSFEENISATNPEVTATPTVVTDNPTPTDTEEEIIDAPEYLKKFGWEDEEQALNELTELRKLKETPPTPQEISFANEKSKQLHEYLRKGDADARRKAIEILQTQDKIESYTSGDINKDNAPEIIKLGIYINSGKRLSQDEVEFQYKQDYGTPKEPVYNELKETEDEFKERHDEWKERVANIEMKKIVAAKMAIPNLETLKDKLELPDISTPQAIDKEYEDYKASNAKSAETYTNVIVPAVNSLKQDDLKLNVKVDDPNNQMQFEVSILPDEKDFKITKEQSLDFFGWVGKTFYDDKGNFLADKLNRAILLEKNFDKYAQSIARQAVNAERKRVVSKDVKGSGMVRDFNINPQQQTELQKEAEKAFAV